MKTTKKVWPFISFDPKDKFRYEGLHAYEASSSVSEYGTITIVLPPVEVEVDYPEDVDQLALEALRAHRTKLRAEHQALLTKLQFLENQLLGLAAPEVLDADGRAPYDA